MDVCRLCLFCVVWVPASATSWSLVQRSSTQLFMIYKPQQWGCPVIKKNSSAVFEYMSNIKQYWHIGLYCFHHKGLAFLKKPALRSFWTPVCTRPTKERHIAEDLNLHVKTSCAVLMRCMVREVGEGNFEEDVWISNWEMRLQNNKWPRTVLYKTANLAADIEWINFEVTGPWDKNGSNKDEHHDSWI